MSIDNRYVLYQLCQLLPYHVFNGLVIKFVVSPIIILLNGAILYILFINDRSYIYKYTSNKYIINLINKDNNK